MNNQTNVPDFRDTLDILFAHRNKAYGAYELRRAYPKVMGRALFYGATLICLVFAVPFFRSKQALTVQDKRIADPIICFTNINPVPVQKPKIQLAELPSSQPKRRSTIKYVPPVVVQDDFDNQDVPPVVDQVLQSVGAVGRVTQAGSQDIPPALSGLPAGPEGGGAGTGTAGPDPVFELFDVQKPPAFPGGEAALYRYLSQHIRYPDFAREQGIEGVVALHFVVDTSGKIQGVTILKDIGGGCGKEALRVVQDMPEWIPGEANGFPVSVRFVLPVRFQLN